MSAVALTGRIVLPDASVVDGVLHLEGGRVARVRPGTDVGRAGPRRWLVPGFVDLHVHGGGGADVMDGPDAARTVAAFHARHGTTALCPTTVTRPLDELRRVVAELGAAGEEGGAAERPGRARLLGVHLEGPFINEKKRGAQPAFTRPVDLAALDLLLAAGPVAIVTLAPELEGALEAVRRLAARGVRASLGHSDADHAAAAAAFAAGAGGVTHLFNAMSTLHHRTPGLAAAALEAEATTHELVLDGHHVHPVLFRIALRAARGRLALVTDAIRAAGLPDGPSELGGQAVRVEGGRALLADGTLAGSVLTLDRALRLAVEAGIALPEAVQLLTRNPADALRRADLGRLAPGALGDVVELDDALAVTRVWRGGVEIELS